MDEQAGPGVFLPSGGNIKAPQTSDVGGGGGGGGEAARAQYSIPGILHFLQHEWARFEVERAQWEVERAELQVSMHGGFLWAPPGKRRGTKPHSEKYKFNISWLIGEYISLVK